MERTKFLIDQSQRGDLQARQELVEANLPLVQSIAARFVERGMEFEDLVQIGSIGLLKAIRDFDFTYDVRFSTFAVPKIMGEIKQYLRKSSMIQVSRSLKKLASDAIYAKDQLAQNLGRNPTIGEIATYLGCEREDVVSALEAVAPVYSLQAPLSHSEENSTEFLDFIAATSEEEHFLLKQALERLDPLEQQIILLRYFGEQSQTEIGEQLGISQAQVSRIENRIIKQLRHEL